jgi:hypothetical protein
MKMAANTNATLLASAVPKSPMSPHIVNQDGSWDLIIEDRRNRCLH